MPKQSVHAEMQRTFLFALPLIGTQLLSISLAAIDTMMAGMISPTALASAGVASMLFDTSFMILVGLFTLLSPMISKAISANDRHQVRHVFQQGLWLALLSGIALFFLTQNMYRIMPIIGVDAQIIPLAKDYLSVTAWMMPIGGVMMSLRTLNEGLSNLKVLFWISLLSIPLNVAGNYVFIHGLFGFPKLGVLGIALSSLIMWVILVAILLAYVLVKPDFKPLRLFKKVERPNSRTLTNMLGNGLPVSLSLIMEVGMFAAVGLLMATLGVNEAAANQIALNFAAMTFMVPLGISMALSIRIGTAVGKNDFQQVRRIGISGIVLSTLIMGVMFLLILFAREAVSSLYTSKVEVIGIATGLLLIAALFQIPDGIQIAASGCLRGLQDTKIPMLYSLLGYWIIGLPVAYYLGIVLDFRGQGLWIGLICGLIITAFLGVNRFLSLTHKHILGKVKHV